MTQNNTTELFSLGCEVATPGAMDALQANHQTAHEFTSRHHTGDWGELTRDDKRANDAALKDGGRLFSAYSLKDGTKIWVITEAVGDDGRRASTCCLLPDGY